MHHALLKKINKYDQTTYTLYKSKMLNRFRLETEEPQKH